MKLVRALFFLGSLAAMAFAPLGETQEIKSPQKQTLEALFRKLSQKSKGRWRFVRKIPLQFKTYHPQGMVKVGAEFYLSSVEITEKPMPTLFEEERLPGKGVGHLFHFDGRGRLVKQTTLGKNNCYHPGGIDTDGTFIWVSLAEYRPQSRSIIYKVNRMSFEAQEAFTVADHIGGVAFDPKEQNLHGLSWDAQAFYVWKTQGQQMSRVPQGGEICKYQECHYVGSGAMLCGGLSQAYDSRGSIALIDLTDHNLISRIDPPKLEMADIVLTRNAMTFEMWGRGLRFYFVPEDNVSAVYVLDLELDP